MFAFLTSESDWADWAGTCAGPRPKQLSLPALTQPSHQLLRQQHLPEQGRPPPLQETGHPAIVDTIYQTIRPLGMEEENIQSFTGCPSLDQVQHTERYRRRSRRRPGSQLRPPSTWVFCS